MKLGRDVERKGKRERDGEGCEKKWKMGREEGEKIEKNEKRNSFVQLLSCSLRFLSLSFVDFVLVLYRLCAVPTFFLVKKSL